MAHTCVRWGIRRLAYTPDCLLLYIGIAHIFCALAVLADPSAANITALSGFSFLPPWVLVQVLLLASVLAIVPLVFRTLTPFCKLCLLLPQQAIVMFSVWLVFLCIWNGAYGDTAIYPRWFIAADQMPLLLAGVLHTYAVLMKGAVLR